MYLLISNMLRRSNLSIRLYLPLHNNKPTMYPLLCIGLMHGVHKVILCRFARCQTESIREWIFVEPAACYQEGGFGLGAGVGSQFEEFWDSPLGDRVETDQGDLECCQQYISGRKPLDCTLPYLKIIP